MHFALSLEVWTIEDRELFQIAMKAKERAYAPYSRYKVGAAVLTDRGNIYAGANVENASFGAASCAERTAVFKAVFEGERKIAAVAVAGDGEDVPYPCGICRQVIAEFSDQDTKVICGNGSGSLETHTLGELLPHAFKLR